MTFKSTEHTVHEETASISQLTIQGMEVLKIQIHNNYIAWNFPSLLEIGSKIPYGIYPQTTHPDFKSRKKTLLAQLNLCRLEKQACEMQN